MFTGVSMHACLLVGSLVHSLVGWLAALFYPCIHLSCVRASVCFVCIQFMPYHYAILHVDGDKRCETFLNCQIGGGRWFWWGVGKCERIARANESQSTCVYSVCLMRRSLMCIVYVMVKLVFRYERKKNEREREKMKLFPIFVPLLTLLAVLFFLVNTILTHQLFTWVASSYVLTFWVGGILFPPLRNRNEVAAAGRVREKTNDDRLRMRETLYWNVFRQIVQLKG